MSREPLHPVVQLKFGIDDFVVSIPPQHLVEFTAIDKKGGSDVANFVFIDPSYHKIDRLILATDKKDSPLLYRWGYPGDGLEKSLWRSSRIETYEPTISHAGLRINLGVRSVGSEFAALVEPRTYIGKISTVIRTIALEIGYKNEDIIIEETDDEDNETNNMEWFSGNRTRIDLMYYFMRIAKSKTNPNDRYDFKLGSNGKFYFRTLRGAKVQTKKEYRVFKVLAGDPTGGVIEFVPQYNAQKIGSWAQSIIASTYDPRTKRFEKRLITRKTLGLEDKENDPKRGRTTAGPLVDDTKPITEQERVSNAHTHLPSRSLATGGRCSGRTSHQYSEPERAFNRVSHAFKSLHESISTASLSLVGLPEYSDFGPDEGYCDVLVVLPEAALGLEDVREGLIESNIERNYSGLHWSSGRYRIQDVTHTIASGYTISANLYRSSMLDGPASASTGPPKKPTTMYVKVQ
jgi:hypothetical protein